MKCGECGSVNVRLRTGEDGYYLFCKDCLEQKQIPRILNHDVELLEEAKRKEGPEGNLQVLMKHMDKMN